MKYKSALKFEVFMAVKIKSVVFWVVAPCSVVGYQHFRGLCCFHLRRSQTTNQLPQCYHKTGQNREVKKIWKSWVRPCHSFL